METFLSIIKDAKNKTEINWIDVENRLNSKLPEDYKEIISTLGTFSLGKNCVFYSPQTENKHLNIFYNDFSIEDEVKDLKVDFSEDFYSYSNDKSELISLDYKSDFGRFIPIGILYDDINIFLSTYSNSIILADFGCCYEENLNCTFNEFLVKLYRKNLYSKILNGELEETCIYFN